MALVAWGAVFVAIFAFGLFMTRMAARNRQDGQHDTGLAIMNFNRAFPNEAIRNLQASIDGKAIFVRLHDNKAGFMRNMQRHFACHLIEPGRAWVTPSDSGRGLTISFLDAPTHDGTYEFASPKEASEVSLWLLGNTIADAERIAPETLKGDLA